MRKALALTAILVASSFYLSCEKDDICSEDTQTTPGVVVEFFNKDNQTALRNVDDLVVIAEGMTDSLSLNETGAKILSTSKIILPLRTNQDVTTYQLIYRSRATDGSRNSDVLTFNYVRNETYVSRACGYKTTFGLELPSSVRNMISAGTDGTQWIATDGISVQNTGIENENETHVKIYF